MPLNIRISIDGINEVRRELDRIDARISNTAPFGLRLFHLLIYVYLMAYKLPIYDKSANAKLVKV